MNSAITLGEQAGSSRPTPVRTIVVEPTRGWVPLSLRDLWEYRELFVFMTWREVTVRYKQTIFGAAWAIIQPVLTMVVFSLFFGRLARMPSDGVPYPIFSYAALVPWTFFTFALTHGSVSLIGNTHLIKKIYFPRLIKPTSTVLAGGVDFILAFVVLLVMMAFYGIYPTATIIWVPLLTLLTLVTSTGVVLWTSAMSVQFRDVKYVIPFLTQIWLFATPIAYSSSLLDPKWRTIYALNPMAGVVEGFRWSLLGTNTRPGPMIFVSSGVAMLILVSGAYYFRRLERTFADVI